jgi:hypothetical protein
MLDHLQGGMGDDQQAAFLTINDELGDAGDCGFGALDRGDDAFDRLGDATESFVAIALHLPCQSPGWDSDNRLAVFGCNGLAGGLDSAVGLACAAVSVVNEYNCQKRMSDQSNPVLGSDDPGA